MEHKTWLWKRKASERTIATGSKSDLAFAKDEEKKEKVLGLEKSLQDLKDQLSSAHSELIAKDKLLEKQTKLTEEAVAGRKKAKAETESLRQDFNDIKIQRAASEERTANIDAALNECKQQLNVSLEGNKQIINDAATKITAEQEKSRSLEKRLTEMNIKLLELVADNNNLGKILEVKEKLIEDLSNTQSQSEADFIAIVSRLDTSEKDNDSLKYEVCMLQKELEIRNQDRDFHLKSADASNRKYLECAKKIAKLESECQRLRVMVRKRLPGPAAIAKMRNEVDVMSNEQRRNKTRYAVDSESENGYDPSRKRASLLAERLLAIEDENNILKEALVKRNNELARMQSKLSHAETQLQELSRGQLSIELARTSPLSYDMPLTSISEDGEDGRNEDAVSCAESWASALISELEHFRNGKAPSTPNRTDVSELSLMDDFAEMEKLAIVCVDKPSRMSNVTSGEITCLVPRESDSKGEVESTCKAIVPAYNEANHENQSWLQDILQVIMQKHHSTNKSLDTIIKEVCAALGNIQHKNVHTSTNAVDEASREFYQSNTGKPLIKLIEHIERILQISTSNRCQEILAKNKGTNSQEYKSALPADHVARVFLWEISELSSVLQHFLVVCNDLLHRKTDVENFASVLVSTLDWIMNHCLTLQDVSNMKDGIKKLIGDNELEELNLKNGSSSSLSATSNGLHILSQMEEIICKIKEENKNLIHQMENMESAKKDLEERLKSACMNNELKEDQILNQKLITEDLKNKLTVAKAELNAAHQDVSSLEVELEDKTNCCEDLESTCMELQLQLQSITTDEVPKGDKDDAEKQLRADWEISAASEKLAECQATILNLGKQLQAMAAPEDAPLFNKVVSSTTLLDHIQADDESRSPKTKEIISIEATAPKSPNAGLFYGSKFQMSTDHNAVNSRGSLNQPSMVRLPEFFYKSYESNSQKKIEVPKRQKSEANLLRKFLLRKKKDGSKNLALTL